MFIVPFQEYESCFINYCFVIDSFDVYEFLRFCHSLWDLPFRNDLSLKFCICVILLFNQCYQLKNVQNSLDNVWFTYLINEVERRWLMFKKGSSTESIKMVWIPCCSRKNSSLIPDARIEYKRLISEVRLKKVKNAIKVRT